MLAGGIPYIVGICNDGLALIINGQKHILDSPHNYTVMKMQRYRNDVYTLTCAKVPSLPTEGSTRIFKGTEPVELDGNITVTDVSFWDRDNIFNLSEISIYDFVVLDK